MLTINDQLSVPLREFKFTFSRSPGPGGQNVNKVNSKVTLRWEIDNNASLPMPVKSRFTKKFVRRFNKQGEFLLTSHRFRDQGRNVADCLNKLREMILSVATVPKPRKKTKPSKASNRRRLDGKRRNADKKRSRKGPTGLD